MEELKATENKDRKTPSTQKKSRKWGWLFFVFIVLAAVAAGWWFGPKLLGRDVPQMTEAEAWTQVNRWLYADQPDSLEEALYIYMKQHEDGPHADEVARLQEQFQTEQEVWKKVVRGECSLERVDAFLSQHPDGFFRGQAIFMMDSLTFQAALDENTESALLSYIEQYPNGMYMKEAQERLKNWGELDMTEEEQEEAEDLIRLHFRAMANGEEGALLTTVSPSLSSYLGKKRSTSEDVVSYMEHMQAKHGSRNFEASHVKVKKIKNAESWIYNVQFKLDEMVTINDSTDVDEKSFSGTAILDDAMRITSLVLEMKP